MQIRSCGTHLFCLALIALYGPSCLGQDKTEMKQAVEAVSKRWDVASKDRDIATLNKILAEDFICTTADGSTLNKQKFVDQTTAENLRYESIVTDDVEMRIYENAACETGRVTAKGIKDGKRFEVRMRYTAVYVLSGDKWLATVYQVTLIRGNS